MTAASRPISSAEPEADDDVAVVDAERRNEAAGQAERLAVDDQPRQRRADRAAERSTPPALRRRPARRSSPPGSPSVRITAISVVRSRTDIAIVLPATNSVVSTTASATLPSSRFRLPSIEANDAENACSVCGLGLVRRVGELRVDRRRRSASRDRGCRSCVTHPADLPLRRRSLVGVLPVEHHRLVVDRGAAGLVDAADGEVEVAASRRPGCRPAASACRRP